MAAVVSDPKRPPVGCHRVLPIRWRLRLPRPIAGCDGAGACRARPHPRASLRAAAHQFREGDVQHWWHPPAGRGVRTHFSDDFCGCLTSPAATSRHVADTGVLDESIPYLEGRPLKPEEDSYYDLPNRSDRIGTLYEHCVAPSNAASNSASMACRSWAAATGTTA